MKRSVGIASDSTKKLLREQIRKRQFRKEESLIIELQHCFWNKIMEGPTYVCFQCEQLWYKESVQVNLVRFSGNTSICEQEEDI